MSVRVVEVRLSLDAVLDEIYAVEALARSASGEADEGRLPMGRREDKALRAIGRRVFSSMALVLSRRMKVRVTDTEGEDLPGLEIEVPSEADAGCIAMLRVHLETALAAGIRQAAWLLTDRVRSDAFGAMFADSLGAVGELFSESSFPAGLRIRPA